MTTKDDASGRVISGVTEDEAPRTTTVLLHRGAQVKRIGGLKQSGLSSSPFAHAVALSPYERRAAVVVVHGSPVGCGGVRRYALIIGADLDARFP